MDEADDQPKQIQVGTYQRTIQARAVQCAHCGQETTIQQYPGYPPRYCSRECKRVVHRVRDRERKARQRAAARATASSGMSDSRVEASDNTVSTDLRPPESAPLPSEHRFDSPTRLSNTMTPSSELLSDTLGQPTDSTAPPPLSAPHPRMSDVVTLFPRPGIPTTSAAASLANDAAADANDEWEDEEAWDEEDGLDDPISSLQCMVSYPRTPSARQGTIIVAAH